MSTKCTLELGDNFHFYEEALDFNNVFLEIENSEVQFWSDGVSNGVTLTIPLDVMEKITESYLKNKEKLENRKENFKQYKKELEKEYGIK